jgi:hypothetical protein
MDSANNCVHLIKHSSDADKAAREAKKSKLHVWRIDLANVHSKAELLDAIGRGLSFPDYFQRNWDSLEECLRDLNDGNGWLIILAHADNLLNLPWRDIVTFGRILSDTAEFWKSEDRAFRVLVVGSESPLETLWPVPVHPAA